MILCLSLSVLAVDECTTNGVVHAIERESCNDLPEKRECQGHDKEACDCCKTAVTVRDFQQIQRDPQACMSSGEDIFSGECLDLYIHCCTGQGTCTCIR